MLAAFPAGETNYRKEADWYREQFEKALEMADEFAEDFRELLDMAKAQDVRISDELTRRTLEKTEEYRDFKATGTKGITSCNIRSVILPLLADHVLREANHYLRLLEQMDMYMD